MPTADSPASSECHGPCPPPLQAKAEQVARAVLDAAKKAASAGELLSPAEAKQVAQLVLNPPKQQEEKVGASCCQLTSGHPAWAQPVPAQSVGQGMQPCPGAGHGGCTACSTLGQLTLVLCTLLRRRLVPHPRCLASPCSVASSSR